MKKIIIALSLLLTFLGCEKEECYQQVTKVYKGGQVEIYEYPNSMQVAFGVFVLYKENGDYTHVFADSVKASVRECVY
jgi:hypothetical protein